LENIHREFIFSDVPIKELTKYDRYHVYASIDLNGDGKFTKDEPLGLKPIKIQEPSDPIENVQVEIN